MKTRTLVLSSILAAMAGAAHASPWYEVEVRGLQGPSIQSGKTVWQPQPDYPKMALRYGLTGEVLVEYTINTRGRAEDIEVLESSPRGFFNSATVRALEGATFGRTYEQGEPVAVENVRKRFVYKIERLDESGDKVATASVR